MGNKNLIFLTFALVVGGLGYCLFSEPEAREQVSDRSNISIEVVEGVKDVVREGNTISVSKRYKEIHQWRTLA